jgi:hypothetical protein
MLFHMQVAREHIEHGVQDLLDVGSVQVYGTPTDAAVEMMKELAGQRVPLIIKPLGLGGFTRSAADQALAPSG